MTILNRKDFEGSNDILPEYKQSDNQTKIIISENIHPYCICGQLATLSEEQESFLLAENNLVSELFKEDKQIEVYIFDENTSESELRKFFYGDENK